MTYSERLRKYNRWRRGDERELHPDPRELGELIDSVADQLEILEGERAELFRLWKEECGKNAAIGWGAMAEETERLCAQRDAWKEVAEHQYGLLRTALYGDSDYPVTGALDAWAAWRHQILSEIATATTLEILK